MSIGLSIASFSSILSNMIDAGICRFPENGEYVVLKAMNIFVLLYKNADHVASNSRGTMEQVVRDSYFHIVYSCMSSTIECCPHTLFKSEIRITTQWTMEQKDIGKTRTHGHIRGIIMLSAISIPCQHVCPFANGVWNYDRPLIVDEAKCRKGRPEITFTRPHNVDNDFHIPSLLCFLRSTEHAQCFCCLGQIPKRIGCASF